MATVQLGTRFLLSTRNSSIDITATKSPIARNIRPNFSTVVSDLTRNSGQVIEGMASKKLSTISATIPTKTRIMMTPTTSAPMLRLGGLDCGGLESPDVASWSGVWVLDTDVTSKI